MCPYCQQQRFQLVFWHGQAVFPQGSPHCGVRWRALSSAQDRAHFLDAALQREFHLLTSEELLTELEDVLSRADLEPRLRVRGRTVAEVRPNPPQSNATMPVRPRRPTSAKTPRYDANAARSPPLLGGALAEPPIAPATRRLRPQRGNPATKLDASAAIVPSSKLCRVGWGVSG